MSSIGVNPVAVKLTPPYFAYLLHANHIGNRVVRPVVHGPPAAFNSNVPAMESSATLSPDGQTLYLAVINRDETNATDTTVDLDNWKIAPGPGVRAFELNGVDRDAANPYGNCSKVSIQEKRLSASDASFHCAFAPHSVTVLEPTRSAP